MYTDEYHIYLPHTTLNWVSLFTDVWKIYTAVTHKAAGFKRVVSCLSNVLQLGTSLSKASPGHRSTFYGQR